MIEEQERAGRREVGMEVGNHPKKSATLSPLEEALFNLVGTTTTDAPPAVMYRIATP